jgi:hypothetical protein
VLTLLLVAEVLRGLKLHAIGLPGVVVALLLGGGLLWASVSANPPPPKPTKPYENAVPDTCRVPFREPTPPSQ